MQINKRKKEDRNEETKQEMEILTWENQLNREKQWDHRRCRRQQKQLEEQMQV